MKRRESEREGASEQASEGENAGLLEEKDASTLAPSPTDRHIQTVLRGIFFSLSMMLTGSPPLVR